MRVAKTTEVLAAADALCYLDLKENDDENLTCIFLNAAAAWPWSHEHNSCVPARAVAATPMPNKKKLIVVFQRGAADGLTFVVPFGEENYYRIRPTIAIPQPRNGAEGAQRSRPILRPAPEPRATRAAVSQWPTRRGSRGRFAGRAPRISTRRIPWSPARPA